MPAFRLIGFFSVRSFSSCASGSPMLYAAHCESAEKIGCAPNGTVVVAPSATLENRSSLLRFGRLMPYEIHRPSGDRPVPGVFCSDSNWP